jgi:virginiamycin B lyase
MSMQRGLTRTAVGLVAAQTVLACGAQAPEAASSSIATPAASAAPAAKTAATSTPAAISTPRPETTGTAAPAPRAASALRIEAFAVPAGSAAHDLAPARNGGVWYTGQASGELGWLDPRSGEVRRVPLGAGSRPHGVIVGADGAAWVTDGGLNAIVKVEESSLAGKVEESSLGVTVYRLPANRPNVNLNTAAFDGEGRLWFTGQAGIIGRLDPRTGAIDVFDAPRGAGPYGITGTPTGDVYFASLAGSYVGKIDRASGAVTVLEPPTRGQGARRVWSDSRGRIWVSEWNVGKVGRYDPRVGHGASGVARRGPRPTRST